MGKFDGLVDVDESGTADEFNKEGFNDDGFNKDGFNEDGFNEEGYNNDGFNEDGFNEAGFNNDGFDDDGLNEDGFNKEGFDADGLDSDGFDSEGLDADGNKKEATGGDEEDDVEKEETDDDGNNVKTLTNGEIKTYDDKGELISHVDADGKDIEVDDSDAFDLKDDFKEDGDIDTPKDFDWNGFGKEMGVEGEEGTDVKDKATFKKAYDDKIEAAKKLVKVDVGTYNESARGVIEHMHNGGTIEDFIDPLKDIRRLQSMEPEDKIREVLKLQGKDAAFIDNYIEEFDDEAAMKKKSDTINDNLSVMAKNKVKEITAGQKTKHDARVASEAAVTETERANITAALDDIETFAGLKISDKNKEIIRKHIKNGRFEKIINNPKALIAAYLHTQLGEKIEGIISKTEKDSRRKGFNDGDEKNKGKLHNSSNTRKNKGSRSTGSKKGFSSIS